MSFKRNFFVNWFNKHGRDFPWRRQGVSPFNLLVTEMLLRQTRASEVAKIWETFVRRYPDAKALAKANRRELRALISILGFGKMRTDALILASRWIVKNCDAQVPTDPLSLMRIPHVGNYAAHAVLCFAHGERREIVDANVLRFFSRYHGSPVKSDIRRNPHISDFARKALPKDGRLAKHHNYGLLDFTAQVCKPVGPLCHNCPLVNSCTGRAVSLKAGR